MKNDKGQETLKLAGDLKIERAGELRDTLLRAFEGTGDLLVDVTGVNEVDVACLQVFCSAHRSFLKAGRLLAFESTPPPEFSKTLAEAGFGRERGCTLNRTRTCLWALGE